MIGTKVATVLGAVNVLLAGLLGLLMGACICAILRRRWNLRVAGIDLALGMIVFFVTAIVSGSIQLYFTHWYPSLAPAWIATVLTIIARHTLGHRSASRQPNRRGP